MKGEYVPGSRLAISSMIKHRARVEIREGVKWSDGNKLSPEDVAYSFGILRQFPALDRKAYGLH